MGCLWSNDIQAAFSLDEAELWHCPSKDTTKRGNNAAKMLRICRVEHDNIGFTP